MGVIQDKNPANDKPKRQRFLAVSLDLLGDHLEDFLFASLQQITQTAQTEPVKEGSKRRQQQ
jgi:hypothetical protein